MTEQASLPKCSDTLQEFTEAFVIPQQDIEDLRLAEAEMNRGLTGNAYEIILRVLQRDPKCVPAIVNMGILLAACGQPHEAEDRFRTAVKLAPENPLVRHFNGIHLLTQGELKEGWDELHWRKHLKEKKTAEHLFPKAKVWRGEQLEKDTHIVVYTEQGKGDEILCATMLPDLLKRTAFVSLVCSPEMVPVFQRAFPSVRVHPRSQANEVFLAEYVAGVSDLGAVLRSEFSDFPLHSKILSADVELAKHLKKEWLGEEDKPVIGIAWKSTQSHNPLAKSTNLKDWARALTNKNYKFVSLQYGDHHQEVADVERRLGISIIEEGGVDFAKDPEKLVTMVEACDLVMGISSTPMHVAGALGKPVWNLTPEAQSKLWYWFSTRVDSPWYPSMKLFRNYPGARTIDQMGFLLEDVWYRPGFK